LQTVKRATAIFLAALATMLVAAPMAFAHNGEGLAGEASDQTVTFFCFGVMAFFVILVIGLSLIQGALDRRKERRRYDIERLN
jgi:putative copper export protein